jgi:hypothetical protein
MSLLLHLQQGRCAVTVVGGVHLNVDERTQHLKAYSMWELGSFWLEERTMRSGYVRVV